MATVATAVLLAQTVLFRVIRWKPARLVGMDDVDGDTAGAAELVMLNASDVTRRYIACQDSQHMNAVHRLKLLAAH